MFSIPFGKEWSLAIAFQFGAFSSQLAEEVSMPSFSSLKLESRNFRHSFGKKIELFVKSCPQRGKKGENNEETKG